MDRMAAAPFQGAKGTDPTDAILPLRAVTNACWRAARWKSLSHPRTRTNCSARSPSRSTWPRGNDTVVPPEYEQSLRAVGLFTVTPPSSSTMRRTPLKRTTMMCWMGRPVRSRTALMIPFWPAKK